jgi:hypothetical protein
MWPRCTHSPSTLISENTAGLLGKEMILIREAQAGRQRYRQESHDDKSRQRGQEVLVFEEPVVMRGHPDHQRLFSENTNVTGNSSHCGSR